MARGAVRVVRCQDQRRILFARLFNQQRQYCVSQGGMNARGRFICQQNFRAMRQGAGNGYTLPLPNG
jgi:hypothetical protein